MFKIIPLTKTTVNWGDYLSAIKETKGYALADKLEKHGILDKDVKTYIETLYFIFKDRTINIVDCIEHINYGFLLIGVKDDFFNLLRKATTFNLSILITSIPNDSNFHLAVITGNLFSWQNFIINCSHSEENRAIRYLANNLLFYFELGERLDIFRELDRITLTDQTIQLNANG